MCGFVGLRYLDGRPVDARELLGLCRLIGHRGPDGEGVWTSGPVGLAHRRLAIIDPGGSPQPQGTPDGMLQVAFNGEILNHTELRRDLDYPFRTRGDTEVLLALHRVRGPGAVGALRGQFAYAIHDLSSQATWLVRDPLGILPLYYLVTPTVVAFASEAKALLPLVPGGPQVDEASLDSYLRRRSVPAPATLFAGIRKIPPGHVARIDRHGRMEMERYWSIPEPGSSRPISRRQAASEVGDALRRSVGSNLLADVPVGAYLSGGLDSSLITALAAAEVGPGLRTFSAGFGDDRAADARYARLVSRHLGTAHTEVDVSPEDFVADMARLTWHRDAPLSEPADLAVNHLAAAAGSSVKVVLSGEGADELFGGYPKHRMAGITHWSRLIPARVRQVVGTGSDHLPARWRRARIGLRALAARTEAERLEAWFSPFTAGEREALLGRPAEGPVSRLPEGGDSLRRMLELDCGSWLADNLLERGDRMTMAASVELRPPFLDLGLVELAFRLPSRVKVRGMTGKVVLRDVAAGLLPPAVLSRPKQGFPVPLDRWFRAGLRDFACDRLLSRSSFVSSVFDRSAVEDLLRSHLSGRGDEQIRIWTLLGLEIWHQVCVLGSGRPGPSSPSGVTSGVGGEPLPAEGVQPLRHANG